jgi:hypothetical protein
MLRPDTLAYRTHAVLVGTLLLVAAGIQAQTESGSSDPDQAQQFEVRSQPGEIVGHEQVVRNFITCGTNQFLFVMPPNVRAERAEAQTLTLTSTDGQYYLSLRLLGASAASASTNQAQARREKTLARYQNAEKIEDFSMNIGGREAAGLQLQQTLPIAGTRCVRVVWVPCRLGTLEFTLNSDAKRTKAALQALDNVLLTLRQDEGGKLEIVRRTEQS